MKSAIITGASKGIGKIIAIHLANKNYNLMLIARDKKNLEDLSNQLKTIHPKLYIQTSACDVFDKESLKLHIGIFLEKVNTISLVFNNAGYVKRGTSMLEDSELVQMINTNLIGAINVLTLIVPIMLKQGEGYIVNIASRNAKQPRPFLGGYAATKAGLLAYSESLYKELKNTNIKVTTLCPGFIDTEMTSDLKVDREQLIPPSDISTALDFLLNLSASTAIKELNLESIIQIGQYC